MKTAYSDEHQMRLQVPETEIEAVEELENFLLCHTDSGALNSKKFIKKHFEICKKRIKEMGE